MKPKILFIMHLPPPVHGASVMGQYIQQSHLINDKFNCIYINQSASKEIDDIGKFHIGKIFFLFKNLKKVIISIIKEKPDICYLTPSSWDYGFYRDWITVNDY